MDNQLKSNGKGVSWRHSVWIFFKAQISAQFASFVDFLVTILLVKAFAVFYLYATFTGSVVGGIVNCAINYGWVFHAEDCKKTHVAVKYLFVWGGSIILNTWGTFALTEWLTGMTWVNGLLGYYIDNVFILSKIIVAVLVAFFWNYHLQRFFVYRNHNIKGFLKHYLENKKDEYPLEHRMIRIGITPNFITTTGLVLNIVAAALFVYAGVYKSGELAYVGWGGGIVLFAGLFDMMDGRVARVGKMSSTFGALYDSVLDRYSELVTLFGIFYYLMLQGYLWGSIITFIALIGSLMVSYVRARAEGLGLECKVGFMQRPERVVLTALGAMFCGIFGDCTLFDPMLILIVPMAVIAILANLTAFARLAHCYKLLKDKE